MLKRFIILAAVMLAVDLVWLTFRASYHADLIKSVQGSAVSLRPIPAALIYLLIPAAVLFFAVDPARTQRDAVKRGAVLGAAMYGLYDLTNLASLKGWTVEMAIIDTLWGTILCGIGAGIGFTLS
jgi:uncharacterized membrane protein